MITSLMGAYAVTKVLFFAGMGVMLGDLVATLFATLYQNVLYKKKRAKYNTDYTPKASIIVPCKGIPKDFGNNLRGFLNLDYPEFEVIFVVEDAADPAVCEIEKIMSEDSRVKFAVAGLATECAQKNYNMLAALRKVEDDSEVFVFADSDIKPEKHWLREIVLPLQDEKVTVTTGFRWLLSQKGSAGELCHAYINIFIYTCFCAACYFGGVGLWGGTMAMRRKDFENLNVTKVWSRASVDDMSLSTLVLNARKKAVLVPTCVTHSNDLLPTVGASVRWFERQIMYLKSYQRPLWYVSFVLTLIASALFCIFPFALIGSLVSSYSFRQLGGGASLVFILGHTLTALCYPALGKMPYLTRFIILQPYLRLMQMLSYLKTMVTRTITWAGIEYKLAYNGDVKVLTRPTDRTLP